MINQQNGYMALIVILIITTTALIAALSVSLLSIEEGRISLTKSISHQGSFVAEACLNEALVRIKEDNIYGIVALRPSADSNIDPDISQDGNCTQGTCTGGNCMCVSALPENTNQGWVITGHVDETRDVEDLYELENYTGSNTINKVTVYLRGAYWDNAGENNTGKAWTIIDDGTIRRGSEEFLPYDATPGINEAEFSTEYDNQTIAWTTQKVNDLKVGLGLKTTAVFTSAWATELRVEVEFVLNLNVGGESCTIVIEEDGVIPDQYNISISATTTDPLSIIVKKITAVAWLDTSNNFVDLISWQEGE